MALHVGLVSPSAVLISAQISLSLSMALAVTLSSFSLSFFLFFAFLGPLPWHMEVPRLGVESEL